MTGLLVVHRPSTVALANRVALLRDGALVAVGTHHELMERPDYASVLSVDYDASSGGHMSAHGAWRGIAAEEVEDVPQAWTGLLRRRTRHLLRSLAAPHRRAIGWLAGAILISNLAGTAVPYLVGLGIDRGVPAVRHDDYAPLVVVTGLIVVCAVTQARAVPGVRRRLGAGRPGDTARAAESESSATSSASASPSTSATRRAG